MDLGLIQVNIDHWYLQVLMMPTHVFKPPIGKSVVIYVLCIYIIHIQIHGGLVAKSCLTLVTPWTVACQAPLVYRIHKSMCDLKSMIYFTRSIQSEDLDSGDTI